MSRSIQIQKKNRAVTDPVSLPSSKSESNRALMIRAYSGNKVEIRNLSDAADTITLSELLNQTHSEYNARDAGTTFRFLTSYLAFSQQHCILTGSERMKQRPVGLLTDALKTLGCQIQYLEKEGYPPLQISPFKWSGKSEISIDATISSQYISSLMMAAPSLPGGLRIHLLNDIASLPYLEMTWELMKQAGAKGSFSRNTIDIPPQSYNSCVLSVESDWSAASYFYGLLALSDNLSGLFLTGLKPDSLQGDSIIRQFARHWRIETRFEKEGASIERKSALRPEKLELDFLGCPDLGQTLVVMCALSGTEAHFTGLQSLAIKETNRLRALQTELAKISVHIEINETAGTCRIAGHQKPQIQNPVFDTYEDHRMAMALSMMATISPVRIREPEVVRKSYPGFWNSMENCGFTCSGKEN